MTLSEFSLKRPVFTFVSSIAIVLFGAIGYSFLGVREYPAIDPPVITVRTQYTGANAEIIESQITEPLEKAINGIEGIRTISSNSTLGVSIITVEFQLSSNLEQAANDVRDKVSQATRTLPQDIDAPPVVTKSDANSDPIIIMPVQSSTRNILELSDYAESVLQEKLQTIPGVSQITVFGNKRYAMRLWISPEKLRAAELSVDDIQRALTAENVELPGGKIRGDKTELTIINAGRLRTEEDFNNLIVRRTATGVIRFSDVGEAVLGPEIEETTAKNNNVDIVALGVVPQPGANHVAIAREFYRRLDLLKKDLPPDITFDISIDKTRFVRRALTEVQETLILSVALVVLIVYMFFRDWRTAVRPLIDIPISLIGTFFIMYLMGFSVNVLTLLGIVLATGLVVDDGIVVTENIFAKMESGMGRMEAAVAGTREIFFAVISTSLTLAIVFLPVVFLQGFTGALFREFGVVLACAVLISAFVSLTITPVLNVRLARSAHRHTRFYELTEPYFEKLNDAYRNTLVRSLRKPWISIAVVIICFGTIAGVGSLLQSELAPLEDRGIVRAMMTSAEGTDFDAMENINMRIAQAYQDSLADDMKMTFQIVASQWQTGAPNTGMCNAILYDRSQRPHSQAQVAQKMQRILKGFPEVRAIPVQEQTISVGFASASQLPVQFVLQNLSFEKLRSFIPKFMDEATKSPVFQGVDVNLKFTKPELRISVDRLKAADLGVSVADVAQTLQLAYSGRRFGYFLMNGKQYQVIGQVERAHRLQPSDLQSLSVRNNRGELIRLENLITMDDAGNPPQIYHFNRYKSATISAGLAPGKTVGDGVAEMEAIAKRVLDDSFVTALSGTSRDFAESGSNIWFAFALALVLIYLVLAAQFESFRDPLIIMITVPLALAGAVVSLFAFGHTLNIFSEIGIIMLIGLVTKNGILIVEFANQQRERGLSIREAVTDAATARLRPILMTSSAMILGALPIALALGAGAQSRVPLGIVVVGGLSFSLLLTLLVIPTMYLLMSGQRHTAVNGSVPPANETEVRA
jgi:multidrug efflux pump